MVAVKTKRHLQTHLNILLAIKHPFIHGTVVTKTRLMTASILVWSAVPLRLVLGLVPTISVIFQGAIVSLVIAFQVLVYREARQHEKQILSQQVSLEAREKFEKEKEALKLTTTIILPIGLSYVRTFILMLILRHGICSVNHLLWEPLFFM